MIVAGAAYVEVCQVRCLACSRRYTAEVNSSMGLIMSASRTAWHSAGIVRLQRGARFSARTRDDTPRRFTGPPAFVPDADADVASVGKLIAEDHSRIGLTRQQHHSGDHNETRKRFHKFFLHWLAFSLLDIASAMPCGPNSFRLNAE